MTTTRRGPRAETPPDCTSCGGTGYIREEYRLPDGRMDHLTHPCGDCRGVVAVRDLERAWDCAECGGRCGSHRSVCRRRPQYEEVAR